MDQERAFLEEIAANPADHATRLVFADWLEERGDARANLLRLLDNCCASRFLIVPRVEDEQRRRFFRGGL